ncbi:hypothetical protein SESBI_29683 [Sesbania bispinosa]|nr:hypothetical protein SESBI_29683 [Sesbania bispinosa]
MESMVFSARTGFHTDVPPKPPDTSGGGMEKPSLKDKVIRERGNESVQHMETMAVVQDSRPSTNGPTTSVQSKVWQRKRPRKELVVGGPLIKYGTNGSAPPNVKERGKGIKSAMPLQRMEGRKLILDDKEDQQSCHQLQDVSNDDDAMDHEDKSKEDNADYGRGPLTENMLTI